MQYSIMEYIAVQYLMSAVRYNIMQYIAVQYSTIQYIVVQYQAINCGIVHSISEVYCIVRAKVTVSLHINIWVYSRKMA